VMPTAKAEIAEEVLEVSRRSVMFDTTYPANAVIVMPGHCSIRAIKRILDPAA